MTIETNHIYNMNFLDLMKMIPDGFARMILTDPPYGIRYQNGYAYEKSLAIAGDTGIDYQEFADQSYRILAENSHAYFFTRFDQYPYHYECLNRAGFRIKNCLVIEKGDVGGIGDLYASYANNCEWVIFGQKGRKAFSKTKLLKNTSPIGKASSRKGNPIQEYKTRFNCCWFGQSYPKATYNSATKAKYGNPHPTMKNVVFLEWLIQISSNPGDIVFDAFMGSGSTAIAARNTGRLYLGSEIDPNHYDTATKRLEMA